MAKKPTRTQSKSRKPKELSTLHRIGLVLVVIAAVFLGTLLYRQINPPTPVVKCTSESCFAPQFKACTPATLKMTLGENAGTKVAVSYEIISAEKNGCKMEFSYTALPNPDWINKPMTCTFDNKKELQVAVGQTVSDIVTGKPTDCTGPLVSVLQSQAQSSQSQQQSQPQ